MTDSPSAPSHDSIAAAESLPDRAAASVGETGVAPVNEDPNIEMKNRTVFEPVSESAPLARQKAAELCRSGASVLSTDAYDCSWYHGTYQYLRLLGLVATPENNAEFFLGVFESMARAGEYPRVLISGTADYSMLAHLMQGYRNGGYIPSVTVLDRCETPLYLCRWYAERMSATIETHACDILEFTAPEPFDLICSHSFLPVISQQQRMGLMSAWRNALRPGGKVVTNARVNPAWQSDIREFSPDQVVAFRDKVYREASKQRETLEALGITPDELAQEAQKYGERTKTFSIRSRQELNDLFRDGGFDVGGLDLVDTGGKFGTQGSGPTTDQSGTYVEIVATRR